MILRALLFSALAVSAIAQDFETAIGQTEQVTRGLVSYWSMRNSGTTVYDERQATDGVAQSSPIFNYTNGVVGSGSKFSGSNYIAINKVYTDTVFSVSVWVKRSPSIGDFKRIFTTDRLTLYGFYVWSRSATGYYAISKPDAIMALAYPPTTNSVWTHLVFTCNGVFADAYIDGVYRTAQRNTSNSVPAITTARIGGAPEEGTGFVGDIDEVRYYSVVLTLDEIKQLYRMGATIYQNR